MRAEKIKAVAHVAPTKGGFGIRIRFSRESSGVWIGCGARAKDTIPDGATLNGHWIWPTAEAATAHLEENVLRENKTMGEN